MRAEVQGFGPDALAGEGRVAVDDDGQDAVDAVAADRDPGGRGRGPWRRDRRLRDGWGSRRGAARRCARCGRANSPVAPMWYLTSPPPRMLRGSTSSKRAKISTGDLPKVFTMTLRRPRWLMPMMDALRAEFGGAVEQLVEEGDEGGDAFEREALGAEIARLDDLLEDVGAGEQIAGCAAGRRQAEPDFEALRDPLAAFAVGDVHELRADGAGVEAAGLGGEFVVEVELGKGQRSEVLVERIELGLEIAPAAEGVEGLLAQWRRREFTRNGRCGHAKQESGKEWGIGARLDGPRKNSVLILRGPQAGAGIFSAVRWARSGPGIPAQCTRRAGG